MNNYKIEMNINSTYIDDEKITHHDHSFKEYWIKGFDLMEYNYKKIKRSMSLNANALNSYDSSYEIIVNVYKIKNKKIYKCKSFTIIKCDNYQEVKYD